MCWSSPGGATRGAGRGRMRGGDPSRGGGTGTGGRRRNEDGAPPPCGGRRSTGSQSGCGSVAQRARDGAGLKPGQADAKTTAPGGGGVPCAVAAFIVATGGKRFRRSASRWPHVDPTTSRGFPPPGPWRGDARGRAVRSGHGTSRTPVGDRAPGTRRTDGEWSGLVGHLAVDGEVEAGLLVLLRDADPEDQVDDLDDDERRDHRVGDRGADGDQLRDHLLGLAVDETGRTADAGDR